MEWDLPSVSTQMVIEWKERFGNIYYVKTGNGTYFFRPIKKKEYDFLIRLGNVDTDDILLAMALLYPRFDIEVFDGKLAGEVDFLVGCINKVSGFSGTEDIIGDIESARTSIGSLENQIAILICKAFPHLTLQEVDHLTYEELIRYLAISEAILDIKLKIEKPESPKPGAIDFDAENKGIDGAVPFGKASSQT